MPASWPGFEARREFRGVTYEIRVRRQGPGGSISLAVDGRPVPGSVVPLPPPGTRLVTVDVTLR
jgi:cellobiose phosphorylase